MFGLDFKEDGDSKFKFNLTYAEYELSQIKPVTTRQDFDFSDDQIDDFEEYPLEDTVFRYYHQDSMWYQKQIVEGKDMTGTIQMPVKGFYDFR